MVKIKMKFVNFDYFFYSIIFKETKMYVHFLPQGFSKLLKIDLIPIIFAFIGTRNFWRNQRKSK